MSPPTKPLWDLPPSPHPKPLETLRERAARLQAEGRARVAIRMRGAAAANARLAIARQIETTNRLLEEKAWLATHRPPSRSEIEALQAMFPGVKAKGKR